MPPHCGFPPSTMMLQRAGAADHAVRIHSGCASVGESLVNRAWSSTQTPCAQPPRARLERGAALFFRPRRCLGHPDPRIDTYGEPVGTIWPPVGGRIANANSIAAGSPRARDCTRTAVAADICTAAGTCCMAAGGGGGPDLALWNPEETTNR
eukprot:SAG31_NODE_57_length_29727_cov_12.584568_22_plen_152_part_00